MASNYGIQFKRSISPQTQPEASQLVEGELAINLADKKLYTLDSNGQVINIGFDYDTYISDGFISQTGGPLTGVLTFDATTYSTVDDDILTGSNYNLVHKKYVDDADEALSLSITDTLSGYLLLDGTSIMTSPLVLSGTPTDPLHAVTKNYCDDKFITTNDQLAIINSRLRVTNTTPIYSDELITRSYTTTTFVPKTGGTFENLQVTKVPTANSDVVRKLELDTVISSVPSGVTLGTSSIKTATLIPNSNVTINADAGNVITGITVQVGSDGKVSTTMSITQRAITLN